MAGGFRGGRGREGRGALDHERAGAGVLGDGQGRFGDQAFERLARAVLALEFRGADAPHLIDNENEGGAGLPRKGIQRSARVAGGNRKGAGLVRFAGGGGRGRDGRGGTGKRRVARDEDGEKAGVVNRAWQVHGVGGNSAPAHRVYRSKLAPGKGSEGWVGRGGHGEV